MLTIWALNFYGIISVQSIVCIYILISAIVYKMAIPIGYDYSSDVSMVYSVILDPVAGQKIYFVLLLVTIFSGVGVKKLFHNNERISVSTEKIQKSVYIWSAICLIYAILNFIFLDKNILWDNNKYLLLNSPSAYNDKFFGGVIYSIGIIFYSISGAVFVVANRFGAKTASVMSGFAFLFGLTYYFSSSSRSVLVLLVVFFCMLWVFYKNIRMYLAIFSPIIFTFVLSALLSGRGSGYFGISNALKILLSGFDNYLDNLSEFLLNVFQGIFITSDGFIFGGVHSELYKILSISPLPSFIDGFDKIREDSEIRLHLFVPMSGVSEAILFGWPYNFFVFAVYFTSLRIVEYIRLNFYGIFYVFMSVFLSFVFIQMCAYPLRNVFKFFTYACFLQAAFIFYKIRAMNSLGA